MKNVNVLEIIIYCYKCFKGHASSKDTFFIGECMHVICRQCFDETKRCVVCQTKVNFKVLDDDFVNKLLQNPTESFIEPIESAMFQVTSGLNLIEKQKSEIAKLHKLLRRAKDEINKHKNVKVQDKLAKGKLFDFDNAASNKNPREVIDRIYYKKNDDQDDIKFVDKNCKLVKPDHKKSNPNNSKNRYLIDLTNKQKKLFTDYNPNEMSFSSSKSMRLTIPQKDSDYKYVYKRQNQK